MVVYIYEYCGDWTHSPFCWFDMDKNNILPRIVTIFQFKFIDLWDIYHGEMNHHINLQWWMFLGTCVEQGIPTRALAGQRRHLFCAWLIVIGILGAISSTSSILGWGLLSQFSPFRYFPNFSASPKYMLAIVYRIHIWQVLQQLSCGDTCQIWMWCKWSNRYFDRIENFAYGEINERSFSNPHPWTIRVMLYGWCKAHRPESYKQETKAPHYWYLWWESTVRWPIMQKPSAMP